MNLLGKQLNLLKINGRSKGTFQNQIKYQNIKLRLNLSFFLRAGNY